MKFFKKEQSEITFIPIIAGMIDDPIIQPQLASKFYPSWWKNTPARVDTGIPLLSKHDKGKTVKTCPSFFHWFNKGVVLPAWCDMTMKYDSKTENWTWTTGFQSEYKIDVHPNDQYLNYVNHKNQGATANFIFKLECPWRAITPDGWSIMQMPMFYDFDNDWSVLPGIIDTDVHHELNQQVVYYKDNEEIFIAKGTPIAHYIPFKRSKTTLEIREPSKKDARRLIASTLQLKSMKIGAYLAKPRINKQ